MLGPIDKQHICQLMVVTQIDQFSPNSDIAYKIIQLVFIPNRRLIGLMKTELQAKKVGDVFVKSYGKMSWWDSFAHHRGCCNKNVWRLS